MFPHESCEFCGRKDSDGHTCRGKARYATADPQVQGIERNLATFMRKFESGATRDSDENKIDYHGFLSHEVLEAYGRYMLKHQKQADGTMRASDNWKKGIPREAYIKSMYRHFQELVALHDQEKLQPDAMRVDQEAVDEALFALLFNVMGYAYERTQGR